MTQAQLKNRAIEELKKNGVQFNYLNSITNATKIEKFEKREPNKYYTIYVRRISKYKWTRVVQIGDYYYYL